MRSCRKKYRGASILVCAESFILKWKGGLDLVKSGFDLVAPYFCRVELEGCIESRLKSYPSTNRFYIYTIFNCNCNLSVNLPESQGIIAEWELDPGRVVPSTVV